MLWHAFVARIVFDNIRTANTFPIHGIAQTKGAIASCYVREEKRRYGSDFEHEMEEKGEMGGNGIQKEVRG